jgi:ankyrin repeat protein
VLRRPHGLKENFMMKLHTLSAALLLSTAVVARAQDTRATTLRAPASRSPVVAEAAMTGDSATVRKLVQQGVSVNIAQGDGMTALHWAASKGNAEMASLLLRARANVNAVTRIGAYTPLHVASEVGSAPVVQALLKAGADPKAATTTGVTPLHLAAMAGSVGAITALVDAGADVNAKEPQWGQTPLMLAAAQGRVEAIKTLLAKRADPAATAKVVDLMARAAEDRLAKQRRNQALAALRTQQGADSQPSWHPNATQVQEAVRAALQVERQAGTVAQAPAEEQTQPTGTSNGGDEDVAGYTEMVGSQGGLTALLLAVREGHTAVVRALLDGGANINQPTPADKTSPLLLACINGHYDLAKLLLERGADVNAASDAGATPLYAIINKEWAPSSRTPQPTYNLQQTTTYLELMEILLKAHANPNARLNRSLWYTTYNRDNLHVDFKGATPFWRAAYATDVPAMKLLFAHGADPNVPTIRPPPRARGGRGGAATGGADMPRQDPSGLPPAPEGGPGIWPIHAASGVGYGQGYAANDHRHVPDAWLPAVKFLVEELGADVNARDFNGYTPLHNAAARGDNEMIRYLVSKGADVKAVARSGQTTVDMANGPVQRISPFLDTIALLESLGAKNNHKCMSC